MIPVNDENSFRHILKHSFQRKSGKENFEHDFQHTYHSRLRASQRGIDYHTLMHILDYGTPFYRQGLVFYTVFEKDIPKRFSRSLRRKILNLVVLLEGTCIITCYRAKNAVKYLKRKQKELVKW